MAVYELKNNFFLFTCSPEQGVFSLQSQRVGLPSFENSRLQISIQKNKRRVFLLNNGWDVYQLMKTTAESAHGKLHQLEFSVFHEDHSLVTRITFALCDDLPLFLWKISLENQSSQAIYVDSLEMLNLGFNHNGHAGRLIPASTQIKPAYAFHSHGWQSWSHTATYREEQVQQHTRLRFIQDVLVQNPGTPVFRNAGHFSSDFFGVLADRSTRIGCLVGFLSQKQHYGSIEANLNEHPRLRVWANGDETRLDPGRAMNTDWAVFYPFYFDQPDPLAAFYDAVMRQHHMIIPPELPAGWCSWYHYYQNIDEHKIQKNLDVIASQQPSLPLSLVQIDDGFEKEVGDWFSFSKGFPHGVAPLAGRIKKLGFTPGLWLAPFILHPRCDFAINNPDMLLRKKNGNPVNAGFIWNVFTNALDLTNPGALDYALDVVGTASHQWGFPYLKLDFLYAGALQGKRFDPTRTRAQILRDSMQAIRDRVGDETFLLGCGAPLGSVLGIVEANRIGADVSGDWTPKYFGTNFFFKNEPHMPSARNSIQNILTRAEQHHRWWINDPDCLLLRPTTNLTLAEVQSLASVIAVTGGSLLISDDLTQLPADRRRIAEVCIPVIGKRAFVMDWLDTVTPHNLRLDLQNKQGEWHVLARFNWKEDEREIFVPIPDFCLAKNNFWVFSFWDKQVTLLASDNPLHIPKIAPHGVALVAMRADNTGPIYLGSDLHISMGLEVSLWEPAADGLSLQITLPRNTSGSIWLVLPQEPKSVHVNAQSVQYEKIMDRVYRIPVTLESNAEIKILYRE
jgi:alpha-galactosidase